jgi:hypothetical protein
MSNMPQPDMPQSNMPTTYAEFWPYYLGEHRKPLTRRWHFAGTGAALLLLFAALAAGSWWLALLALVAGYGPAWIGHFFVEHNRPATFKYPLWSLVSDFKMFSLFVRGRLDAELERHGVR